MHDEEMPPTTNPALTSRSVSEHDMSNSQTVFGARSRFRIPLWLLTLGAGLVSGLISWVCGELMFNLFRMEDSIVYPENYKQISGYQKQNVTAKIQGDATRIVERKKSTASFGLLGLSLGVSLALAGGLASRCLRTALSGAILGGLSGAVAGAGLAYAAVPLFYRYFDHEQGLLILFFTHAAIFTGLGAAAGLGLGLGLENRSTISAAVFGGMIGALIGTVAFETTLSLAFPLMRTFEPISTERLPRMLLYLCVALCTGLLSGMMCDRSPLRPISSSST